MDVITIGADIGQRVDPTAIVVCEAVRRQRVPAGPWELPPRAGYVGSAEIRRAPAQYETVFTARHLERLPLGTQYPDVAERVAEVVRNIHKRYPSGRVRLRLTVDATGVGRPLVDLLRVALLGVPVTLIAATFVHGDRLDGHSSSREVKVGKAYLVSRLQALIQTDRLHLPAQHAEAQVMARELADYEIKVDLNANDTYGAFRVGSHDDLVTALGLAVLTDATAPTIWTI